MPWLSVNHTRLCRLSAVPTPDLALEVQRGSIPGQPGAKRISGSLTGSCPRLTVLYNSLTQVLQMVSTFASNVQDDAVIAIAIAKVGNGRIPERQSQIGRASCRERG